jgi:hypothetical protein
LRLREGAAAAAAFLWLSEAAKRGSGRPPDDDR